VLRALAYFLPPVIVKQKTSMVLRVLVSSRMPGATQYLAARSGLRITMYGYKLDRQFTDTVYGFGRLRFDVDDFGNIDSRTTGVVGIGKRFFDDGKQAFSGEIGIGGQDTNFIIQGLDVPAPDPDAVDENGLPIVTAQGVDDDAGAVLYGGLTYSNILNERVTFNSVFSFEAADVNTLTVWDNSLNVSLSDRISLSFGILARNNSEIEGELGETTDTATRFNIVYGI